MIENGDSPGVIDVYVREIRGMKNTVTGPNVTIDCSEEAPRNLKHLIFGFRKRALGATTAVARRCEKVLIMSVRKTIFFFALESVRSWTN